MAPRLQARIHGRTWTENFRICAVECTVSVMNGVTEIKPSRRKAPLRLVCCGCDLTCHSSDDCGRMVPAVTSRSRVVNPEPVFSADPTMLTTTPFLDCSHDDIMLFFHQQFTVVSFSNSLQRQISRFATRRNVHFNGHFLRRITTTHYLH